ncbi:MAG TPA: chalcone isomerase family protein [Rhodocyclaceae bacterium]|jgi:hypothetical protein|nr:chalcone isomerase family protein [Rhodocyclaceae bacterium]
MKVLLYVFLTAISLPVWARLPVPVADAERWQVQGSGEMRWFGFSIYNARLWRSGDSWQRDAPYALELTYSRSISAEQLVSVSLEEIERLGEKDEARLQQWRKALGQVFPSVREGDVIIGLHEPGRGARFFYNGRANGSISDARLAAAFFAIWLDPRTKAPELRARLLAEAASVP